MAVYARRSRTRHKPAWRAKQREPEAEQQRGPEAEKQRGPEAEKQRETRHSTPARDTRAPRPQEVDPAEPVGTPETNQPGADQPRK